MSPEQAFAAPVPVHRRDDNTVWVARIPAGWSPTLPVVWRGPAPASQCDASQDPWSGPRAWLETASSTAGSQSDVGAQASGSQVQRHVRRSRCRAHQFWLYVWLLLHPDGFHHTEQTSRGDDALDAIARAPLDQDRCFFHGRLLVPD